MITAKVLVKTAVALHPKLAEQLPALDGPSETHPVTSQIDLTHHRRGA